VKGAGRGIGHDWIGLGGLLPVIQRPSSRLWEKIAGLRPFHAPLADRHAAEAFMLDAKLPITNAH